MKQELTRKEIIKMNKRLVREYNLLIEKEKKEKQKNKK